MTVPQRDSTLTGSLELAPIAAAAGTIALPGSKSISNRALLLAALARGTTRLAGVLEADDTGRMVAALRALGVVVSAGTCAGDWTVEGQSGRFPVARAALGLGNAGTAVRPLTAALAMHGGDYTIDGVARMRERPIGDLVDTLRAAGCTLHYLGSTAIRRSRSGCPVAGPEERCRFAVTCRASSSRRSFSHFPSPPGPPRGRRG